MGVKKKQVRVGMIGYKLMGKAHSNAYRNLPFFFDTEAVPVMQAIAGRDEQGVQEAAEKMGWASYETDWRRLIERADIDLIDIGTPNHVQAEMAIAAAKAGKHILCEKPLTMTVEQAQQLLEAVQEAGVVHMISHNYRFAPAVQFAKKLIVEGRLGEIYHIRATYLQDWIMDPQFPLVWRLQKEVSGSGAHGDLAAHMLDLARFLVGEFKEVIGMMETFIKERPIAGNSEGLSASSNTEEKGEVNVDDASVFMSRFENGAIGTFEATRFAGGNRNGNRFEINGEKGSIRWDMENMNNLEVYFADDEPGLQGFRTINCTEQHHPFAGAYWPDGHIIGYTKRRIPLSLFELIESINPVIRGWGNYYRKANVRKLFNKLQRWIVRRIWSHRFKRWRNMGWKKLHESKLYSDYKLVNLISLIPDLESKVASKG